MSSKNLAVAEVAAVAEATAASSSTSAASRVNYDNQGGGAGGSSNSASSSWRINSYSHDNKGRLDLESDEDMLTVPDVEAPEICAKMGDMRDSSIMNKNNIINNINSNAANDACKNKEDQQNNGNCRRGRNPVDREHRRLKRLLRNRVSAQQARERKKVYVSDLESRATELQDRNCKLEEKISTLVHENTMLRKVLLNTQPKADESNEPNP